MSVTAVPLRSAGLSDWVSPDADSLGESDETQLANEDNSPTLGTDTAQLRALGRGRFKSGMN